VTGGVDVVVTATVVGGALDEEVALWWPVAQAATTMAQALTASVLATAWNLGTH
jgi:hypothetical protein